MKAAIVREVGKPPVYDDFDDPVAKPGELLISVSAAGVSRLVVSRATGRHYSVDARPPFVIGVDGVGRAADGRRLYFSFVRPPFGTMAERAPTKPEFTTAIPDGMDDVAAAATALSGMSCWVPLTRRAPLRPGESVLVNGATGAAGQMAIQVAKHLGARAVIATGRDEAKFASLRELGADVVLSLREPETELVERIRKEAREWEVGVVLDYLWGSTAETILNALGGPDGPRGSSRITFVQIGTLAGPTITLEGAKLRSSGVEIIGTGLGSSTYPDLVAAIGEFFRAFVAGRFRYRAEARPLSDVERAWSAVGGETRIVFTVP